MKKGKKMGIGSDDLEFDLDFEEIKGDSEKIDLSAIDEVLEFLNDENENISESEFPNQKPLIKEHQLFDYHSYEAVCERLRNYCNKRWVCLPILDKEKEKYISKDIFSLSNDQFHSWVNKLWPSANIKDHRAEVYESKEARERTHELLINLHKSLKFPSMDQIMPVLKLNKKKKEKK